MSMKLALECPTHMLEMVQPFADYSFILSEKARSDEEYFKYYKEDTSMKILDCSTNEEGEPTDIDTLLEIAKALDVTFVVSPDWFGDAKQTIRSYQEFIKKWPLERTIGVLQGETFVDAYECYYHYECPIAIPYAVCSDKENDPPQLMELRRALLASNIPSDREIHLLGFTTF